MEAIPRNDGEQYRFDAFCKAVLRNEARNYHRNKKRLLDREKSFSVLSMEELGQLTSVDHYPCEESVCRKGQRCMGAAAPHSLQLCGHHRDSKCTSFADTRCVGEYKKRRSCELRPL